MKHYLNSLLNDVKDIRVRSNFEDLVTKIVETHSIQIWALSRAPNEFNRFRDLLNNNLKNGLSVEKLQRSQLSNFKGTLDGKTYILVVHDVSDIRKPNAVMLENIGWVKSLEGGWVRGYSTLNSIAVLVTEGVVRLLRCTPYSSKEPDFVSKKDLKLYETGQIKDDLQRKSIEELLAKEENFNTDSLIRTHIRETHQAIKSENPDCIIVHILDRGYDSESLFDYIESLGDYFVIRMKSSRKDENTEQKLLEMELTDEHRQTFTQIGYQDKKYENVQVTYQWGCWKKYDILRVRMKHLPTNTLIAKEPMLLVTNLQISSPLLALLVFQYYLNRWKIESLFRFLKQVLGWEEFLIRDWKSIENLITLAFFVGGYFYEIEDELTKDESIAWLAELGGGKGKVTRGYVMRGITQLMKTQHTLDFLTENNITAQQVEAVLQRFTPQKKGNPLIERALSNNHIFS